MNPLPSLVTQQSTHLNTYTRYPYTTNFMSRLAQWGGLYTFLFGTGVQQHLLKESYLGTTIPIDLMPTCLYFIVSYSNHPTCSIYPLLFSIYFLTQPLLYPNFQHCTGVQIESIGCTDVQYSIHQRSITLAYILLSQYSTIFSCRAETPDTGDSFLQHCQDAQAGPFFYLFERGHPISKMIRQ